MLSRIEFHYTPKHVSGLNIAEIEINVLDIQCTGRRSESFGELERNVKVRKKRRNEDKAIITQSLTGEKADKKLSKHYTAQLMGHDASRGSSCLSLPCCYLHG